MTGGGASVCRLARDADQGRAAAHATPVTSLQGCHMAKRLATRAATRSRAFTLVELLVVLTIIALLISLLLPTLGKAKAQANAVLCSTNLRNLGQAIHLYATENKDMVPPGYIEYSNGETAIWPHFVAKALLKVSGTHQGAYIHKERDRIVKLLRCPNGVLPDADFYYSAHPVIFPDYYYHQPPAQVLDIKPAKLGRLRSDNILIMDGVQFPYGGWAVNSLAMNIDEGLLYPGYVFPAFRHQWYLNPADPNKNDPLWGNEWPIEPGPNTDADEAFARIRWRERIQTPGSPRGASNFLFPDGRVETLHMKDVKRRMILIDR
jgi:prepilin-type N-terminal cleavage/methylation domain-containing protein